jgi:DNA ligase (NAD+)
MDYLDSLRLPVSPKRRVVKDLEGLLSYYHNIGRERPTLPYDIDGVVYKVDDIKLQERLGSCRVRRDSRWPISFPPRRPLPRYWIFPYK